MFYGNCSYLYQITDDTSTKLWDQVKMPMTCWANNCLHWVLFYCKASFWIIFHFIFLLLMLLGHLLHCQWSSSVPGLFQCTSCVETHAFVILIFSPLLSPSHTCMIKSSVWHWNFRCPSWLQTCASVVLTAIFFWPQSLVWRSHLTLPWSRRNWCGHCNRCRHGDVWNQCPGSNPRQSAFCQTEYWSYYRRIMIAPI